VPESRLNEPNVRRSGELHDVVPAVVLRHTDHNEPLGGIDPHDLQAVMAANVLYSNEVGVANDGETELLILVELAVQHHIWPMRKVVVVVPVRVMKPVLNDNNRAMGVMRTMDLSVCRESKTQHQATSQCVLNHRTSFDSLSMHP
jgi:hypothetical protein